VIAIGATTGRTIGAGCGAGVHAASATTSAFTILTTRLAVSIVRRMWKALVLVAVVSQAAAEPLTPQQELARSIYKELVEINTTQSTGDTFKAAKAMAARLVKGGIPAADVKTFQTAPKRGNLVARLRGTGKKKPMMLLAHIDVVEAKREDWSTDPFAFVEKDGYFYGRGTADDKAMAATWVATLIRLKKEGYKGDRDLVLVLETDEEISDTNNLGMRWLIANQRKLIDVEFAINEGAGVGMKDGKPLWNAIQTTEKTFQSFWLEVRNSGGHSSQPRADNAIFELAAGLGRLEKHTFPVELNETTRGYFTKMATVETGQLATDMKAAVAAKPDAAAIARLSAMPPYNAQLRTTCTATRLEAGHADNALPQLARAMINCRAVPGTKIDDLQKTLERVLANAKITVTAVKRDTTSEPSPMQADLLSAVETLTQKYWPGIPVIPVMSAGATDGRFLRNAGIPTYGHSGVAGDIFDVRAHGRDERVSIKAFFDEQEYLYELVKVLAGP
jgi:acetylornithine deacetylase/succinyl-diaminopimelate desuccinylase-like protein